MKHKLSVLMTSLFAMSFCGVALADKHEGNEGKKKLEAHHERLQKVLRGDGNPDSAKMPSREKHMNLRVCRGTFTVDYVYETPHIKDGDKFNVVGPISWANFLIVTPIGGGSGDKWVVKAYPATPDGTPSDYTIKPRVKPHNSNAEGAVHNYLLRVDEWDGGCPEYISFVHRNHEYDLFMPLDPGHAGASRD